MRRLYRYRCCVCSTAQTSNAGASACTCAPSARLEVECPKNGDGREVRSLFEGDSMWRYAPLFPADSRFSSPLKVGGTLLYDLGSHGGIQLFLKDESRNPSGSLKDRASELVLAVARENGLEHVVTASTGNAAASLACLAAAQKMRATIFVPASAPRAKLLQVMAFGADIVEVDGDYDLAFSRAADFAKGTGAFCRNTGSNPFTREGKKTVAFEIAEQFGWRAPDWIIVPVGDGNIVSGVAKGFAELRALGLIPRTAGIVAVQARSSNAISVGMRRARLDGDRVPQIVMVTPETRADSIAVGESKDFNAAVRALLANDGICVELEDDEILRATRDIASRHGVFLEPSAAATYSALQRLLSQGVMHGSEKVVLIGTGGGLKDPSACFEEQRS